MSLCKHTDTTTFYSNTKSWNYLHFRFLSFFFFSLFAEVNIGKCKMPHQFPIRVILYILKHFSPSGPNFEVHSYVKHTAPLEVLNIF